MDTFLAALIIFIGSFVQSSIGFGLAIVAAPFLFLLSPDYVPAPITLVALVLSVANAYRYRSNISLKGLGAAIVGRIPGTVAGGALLLWVDAKSLSLWLGLSVLIAVAVSLLPVRIAPTTPRMLMAGFLSGFMGTSTAIGGPFFIVSCILSLLVQGYTGHMSWHHFMLTLPLIPAMLLGYWLATRYVERIANHHIRVASLCICSLSGIGAIALYWMS